MRRKLINDLFSPARRGRLMTAWLLIVLLAAVDGCSFLKPAGGQEEEFLLRADSSAGAVGGHPDRACIVRLLPVEVPAYLQTRDMVMRTGANTIVYAIYHQWAEPLDAGIRRVLAEDLKSSPQIEEVLTDEPSPEHRKLYILSIHILACEGNDVSGRGSVVFRAAWEISESGGKAVRIRGVFGAPQSHWNPGDYADLAGQLSRATAELSRVLARRISANH